MNYIKIKIFLIVFLSLNAFISGKENSLKFIPEKPKAGEEIIVVYNPAGTPLEKADSVKIIYSIYSKKCTDPNGIESTSSINMKKEGNNWTAKIRTYSTTDMGAIKFISGNLKDSNDEKGYFLKLYDSNGNETLESIMGCAVCNIIWGWKVPYGYMNINKVKIKKELNGLLKAHPELKTAYLYEYLFFQANISAEDRSITLIDELKEFEKRSDLSEEEYIVISSMYSMLKMPEKAKVIKEKIKQAYPKGITVFRIILDSLKKEKDINRQFEMTKEKIKYFAGTKHPSSLASSIFTIIAEKGSPEFIREYIVYMMNERMITYEYCPTYLRALVDKKINLDLALTLANIGLDGSYKEYIKPSREGDNKWAEDALMYSTKNDYYHSLLWHVDVLALLNRKEEALKEYEIILSICPLNKLQDHYVETYLNYLPEKKRYETAEPVIEEFIKSKKATKTMKALLKEIYIKKNGSDSGYDEYVKKMEDETKLMEIKNKKPAPDFTLMDIDGKNVSLSNYKGKIVILDFWATWCGWCKKSFPQMKQAVEKYAGKDVVFLFVDTMEKEDNAKEKAKEFITQNNYPFYVVFDTGSKVSKSFGVTGLPTKVFVDKEGNVCYGTPGYSDQIVEEIDRIIELLK